MSTSELIAQIVHDALFEIRNLVDETKKVVWNLAGATTNKVLTLVAEHTDNRTLKFPDKSGTLCTIESVRETLIDSVLDFSKHEIAYRLLPASQTLSIINPVQGKMVLLEVDPVGFDLILPASCLILSGSFKNNTKNYLYFHCIQEGVPQYVVTIGQQIA